MEKTGPCRVLVEEHFGMVFSFGGNEKSVKTKMNLSFSGA
jgi:hypothetical protein